MNTEQILWLAITTLSFLFACGTYVQRTKAELRHLDLALRVADERCGVARERADLAETHAKVWREIHDRTAAQNAELRAELQKRGTP